MSDDTKQIRNSERPKPPNAGKGRPKGSLNKITADVRVLATQYGEKAIKTLAEIMEDGAQPAAARVSAAKEILDRAYGKSPQPITDGDGGSLADAVSKLVEALPN